MSTPPETAWTAAAGEPPSRWSVAYLVALPALVALAPVVWPLLLVLPSGWRSTPAGGALPGWPFLLLGLVWARQVLSAATDELAGRAEQGALDEAAAGRYQRWLRWSVWPLLLLLPLRYHALHAGCERWHLRLSSGTAVHQVRAASESHLATWRRDHAPGKAWQPDDPRFDPAQFGGPFAPRSANAVGKLAFDAHGRLFYILDRPRSDGPGRLVRQLFSGKGGERQWVWERGLVAVPAGEAAPRATVWDLPVRRVVPLGHHWYWYVAGEPEELG